MKSFNKKGALEVSINAIIILIFAIAILALGLTFMRNMFRGATKQFGEVSAQVKTDLIENLKSSSDKIAIQPISIDVDTTTKTGEVYYGIRNINDVEIDFYIPQPNCVSIDDPTDIRVPSVATYTRLTVKEGESDVQPAKITITSTTARTSFKCTIRVFDGEGGQLYSEKSFFVNVVEK
ncbi:MAG: hypothetical protein NTV63_05465 [Candidatus Woesearchaeota archaeon]|nr:hypothetical protein [Candidatus Woesearchaeota archaeon]